MKDNSTITIIGAGYVGVSTAALLSNSGYKVYLLDLNQKRIDILKQGRSFFYEEGIDPLLSVAVKKGSLIPTMSYEQSVPESHIVFSCVGTPDNPDGSSNLSYVFSCAKTASELMPNGSIFIQKSTVPVGTGKQIEEQFKQDGKDINYVSNPEFLREGTAILDSLWFDRVVVGGNSEQANKQVVALYKSIERHREQMAKLAKIDGPKTHNGEYFTCNRNSAELIKVTANAFLALKISFANSIAKLADNAEADVVEVMDAVGADRRIGRAFLNAGRGYGGGCFPKDVSGLIASADEHGVDMPIMVSATDVNESMAGYISNKAKGVLGDLKVKKVAVLGLAFKAGTSDARRSPGVKLANILARSGSNVCVYDPKANGEAAEDLRRDVIICKDVETAIKEVDAVFVATAWPEFSESNLGDWKKLMKGKLLVDCDNSFTPSDVKKAGLEYMGVGRS